MKYIKAHTIAELTALMPCEVVVKGNADIKVLGMNEIHMVENGDITFVDLDKYYDKALASLASIILIDKEVPCPEGKCLLITQDPMGCFNALTRYFRPFIPCQSNISPSAQIGEGTVIQPFVFVGNYVKIGKNCIIHSNVSIYDYTEIGDNVIIQSNSVIGGDAYYFQRSPQGLRKFESSGRTILGDDVEIGALCAVDKGVSGDTIIGQGTKLDNFVQIGHDTHIGKHCLIGSHCAVAGVTTLEDHVILWADVMVNKDLLLEEGAIVLATSAVDKNLEKGKIYFGVPATDARRKWRELAAAKMLPEVLEKIKHLL